MQRRLYDWVNYRNGNYLVRLNLKNGTKIRETEDENFLPSFAESCDLKITDKCDGACPYCYEGCFIKGEHCDFSKYKFLDTLHSGTELAINGNDLSHPQLLSFLYKMKDLGVIVNMTVNQVHFERNFELIQNLVEKNLIYGLGISLRKTSGEFLDKVQCFLNAVIHVINGIVSISDLKNFAEKDLKILILGYKDLRLGDSYHKKHENEVSEKQSELKKYLFTRIIPEGWFKIVSFDNLALAQLSAKEHLSEKEWEEFYMGNDSEFTFYIDLVKGVFGKSSLAPEGERYPIMENIDDMFQKIRKIKEDKV